MMLHRHMGWEPGDGVLNIVVDVHQEREELLAQLEKRPDSMWKAGTIWSFRNEAKVYGSPMFDSAWDAVHGRQMDPLPPVIAVLRAAPVPFVSPTLAPESVADEAPALAVTPTRQQPPEHARGLLAVPNALAKPE